MIGKTISQYKIIERIGAGGMGEVFLAEDTELHRRVAFKFLPSGYTADASTLERFKREAQAAAALNHPNIITIYNVGTHEGRPYIVMEHVEGETLGALIDRKTISVDRALEIASQICDGLAKSHAADIVHRDVKPANILIDTDGRVRILDFGLAKLHGMTQITDEASTVGTINYMSPEQARGEEVDHRSDLFSLAVVLYEMVTGQRPFDGEHKAAVMYAITTQEAQPLRRFNNTVSDGLEAIVSKALSKDPGERYQTAADMLADLRRERRLLTGKPAGTGAQSPVGSGGAPTRPDSSGSLAPAAGRRSRLPFVIGAIVVAAVVIGVLLNPFSVDLDTDAPAVAQDNSLAIMYFDNLADPGDEQRLGEIITSLLITDLSDVSGLRVVSSQRLYDILKNLDREGAKKIDQSTASQVARAANARFMLLGNVLQEEPSMVVASQVVDVASGDVVHSQRVTGEAGGSVFDLVDLLSEKLRSDLAPSADTDHAPVSVVTTTSEAAYKHYLEGWEHLQLNNKTQAIEGFRAAIRYDSTFAMAYFQLAHPGLTVFTPVEQIAYVDKAYALIDQVGERDRMAIRALHQAYHQDTRGAVATLKRLLDKYPDDKLSNQRLGSMYWHALSNPDSAEHYWLRTAELDPKYGLVYNSLAYFYMDRGDADRALWAIDNYLSVEPDTPNAHDSRGEILATFGRTEEAIEAYERSLQLNPSFEGSKWGLGAIYLTLGEPVKAEFQFRRISPNRGFAKWFVLLGLGLIDVHRGQLRDAVARMDEVIDQPPIEGRLPYLIAQVTRARLLHRLGEAAAAVVAAREADRASQLAGQLPQGWGGLEAELLAIMGRTAEAEALVESVPAETMELRGRRTTLTYWYTRAVIAFERGDYNTALAHLEQAGRSGATFETTVLGARALLETGRTAEAVIDFEKALANHAPLRVTTPFLSVLVHYYAGVAYEESGWSDKAMAQYEQFLEWWGDADFDAPEIDDARERLEKLRRGS